MKVKTFGGPIHAEPATPCYIGIDPSYSGFGITVLMYDEYFTQVIKFDNSGSTRLANIYEYLQNYLESITDEHPIKEVAMEGYAYGSQMSHMLGELGGVVKLALHYYGIEPLIVAPTSLKKYVTGKGTGVQKNVMLLSTYKKWGIEFTDDNAADSYALARIASKYSTTDYEKAVLDKVYGELNGE